VGFAAAFAEEDSLDGFQMMRISKRRELKLTEKFSQEVLVYSVCLVCLVYWVSLVNIQRMTEKFSQAC
jgi:hypothetical protein